MNSFGLKEETVQKILQVFFGHPKIENAVIYGSRAKGNYRTGSDIDICLEASEMDLSELMLIETELDDLLLPYKIDLSLKHKIENKDLLDHIERVGKKLI
ncbi:nucleotidyltransferase domain-containing protein [Leptospira ilyithenensis]|uniref:Nucleotidyltransferase domain-containing protein n=1 Tax=Leptospira ilyithenensis TaxID=2484901 RepID=A0A4R9LLY2_9LEPT|nr:nucleotidyltransferase domain-containing protein [Leptospira ilyithenensis]TGN07954.1 nucleotidyltransferase domain-containing protein [Leptospira ilyithenensis]